MTLTAIEKLARNNIAAKKYYEKNKEKIAADRAKKNESRAAYMRDYRVKNGDKLRATSAAWDDENSERAKQNRAAYYQANKIKISEDHKNWWLQNPERVLELKRKWIKENPQRARDIARTCTANRRGRKMSAGQGLSVGIAQHLFKLQRGKCACCGSSLKRGFHLDHIVPLALGGANEDYNIQLLTPRCNLQKHKKDPIDFMRSRGRLI